MKDILKALKKKWRGIFPLIEYNILKVDKTVMISLKQQDDRRTRVYKAFPNWDIAHFSAVDGWGMDDSELPEDMCGGCLYPGEIGVLLSHHALWKALSASDDERWLILEDNILPSGLWKSKDIQKLNDELNKEGYDLILLGGEREVKDVPGVYGTYQRLRMKTFAYVVNRKGAERLIAAFNDVGRPFNEWLPSVKDLDILELFPPFICHAGLESTTRKHPSKHRKE